MKNKNKLIAGIFLALFGFQANAIISYDDTGLGRVLRQCTENEYNRYLEEGFGNVKILTSASSQTYLALYSNEISGGSCHVSHLQEKSHTIEFIFDEERDELEEGIECDAEGCVSYEYLDNNKVRVLRYTFHIHKVLNNIETAVNLYRSADEKEMNYNKFQNEESYKKRKLEF